MTTPNEPKSGKSDPDELSPWGWLLFFCFLGACIGVLFFPGSYNPPLEKRAEATVYGALGGAGVYLLGRLTQLLVRLTKNRE